MSDDDDYTGGHPSGGFMPFIFGPAMTPEQMQEQKRKMEESAELQSSAFMDFIDGLTLTQIRFLDDFLSLVAPTVPQVAFMRGNMHRRAWEQYNFNTALNRNVGELLGDADKFLQGLTDDGPTDTAEEK